MDPESGSRLLDPDQPKQSVLSGMVENMLPACLFVFAASLFVFAACLLGV